MASSKRAINFIVVGIDSKSGLLYTVKSWDYINFASVHFSCLGRVSPCVGNLRFVQQ